MLAVARAERVARLGVRRLVLLGREQRRGVALLELDGVDLAEPRGHRDHPLGELEVAPVVAADLGDDVGSRHDCAIVVRVRRGPRTRGRTAVGYRPARWRRACTTSKQVLADLVRAYARRDPPRSVTIVGNAPLPPCPQRAALIDDSDLVVRMTTFALDAPGGPPCIGRRTDVVLLHRAVVPGPGTFYDHASRLYLLVEPGRLHWEREDRPDWWPVHAVSVPNHLFAVALKELMGIPADEAAWPTTGTLAALRLLRAVPEAVVRLTGTTVAERAGADRVRARLGTRGRGHRRAPPRRGGRAPAQVGGAGPDRAGRMNLRTLLVAPLRPLPAERPDPHRQRRRARREQRAGRGGRGRPAGSARRRGRRAARRPRRALGESTGRVDELDDQLRRISAQLVALEQRVGDLERPAVDLAADDTDRHAARALVDEVRLEHGRPRRVWPRSRTTRSGSPGWNAMPTLVRDDLRR